MIGDMVALRLTRYSLDVCLLGAAAVDLDLLIFARASQVPIQLFFVQLVVFFDFL